MEQIKGEHIEVEELLLECTYLVGIYYMAVRVTQLMEGPKEFFAHLPKMSFSMEHQFLTMALLHTLRPHLICGRMVDKLLLCRCSFEQPTLHIWNQVQSLLDDDPGNPEYADMEKELAEVIALTEELLATAKQSENSGKDIGTTANASHNLYHSPGSSGQTMESRMMSDDAEKLPVGSRVRAVWSEDGEWYDATIKAHTPNGYYVSYDGWGNEEEVDLPNVMPIQEGTVNALLEAEKEAEATREALKRKIAQAAVSDFQSRSLPEKLRIDPNDPEDVKAAKRKKIHAFKSKVRKEQLEVTQNKRQNAWQQFQTTKGKTKKIGFFSGRKRESIFKSPEDPFGKVGVTGSGKGLTDFQKREKHLHLKGANIETGED